MAFLHQRTNSATQAFDVTESDDVVYSPPLRGIYVGGAGNLDVVLVGDPDGNVSHFDNIAVGVIHPLQVKKVMASTTATLIVGVR
jgi:hypothetical protein